jgi:hypothetical protein
MKCSRWFLLSLLFILLINISTSCKKAVDNIQQNAIYEIITNGRWTVSRFDVAGVAKKNDYTGYEFQFFSNGVVTAFKESNSDINGNWSASIENLTITSEFPGQGDPLRRFNTVWFITRTTETTVQARASVAGEEYILGLLKK